MLWVALSIVVSGAGVCARAQESQGRHMSALLSIVW
jgi:hypothetical protein